jgi:drug/metabolite transporter (DMT)-like permease
LSIVAAGLAGAGAYLLSTGGRFELQRGDALELVGALFWALHVVVLGKFASRFASISFSVGQLLVCGILNLAVGLFFEQPVFTLPLASAAVYTAVMALGICYTLQVWAQKHTPPADAALLLSLESVFAVVAGWLFLGEQLAGIQYFGCLLIFLAVLLCQVKEWNSGKIRFDRPVEGK